MLAQKKTMLLSSCTFKGQNHHSIRDAVTFTRRPAVTTNRMLWSYPCTFFGCVPYCTEWLVLCEQSHLDWTPLVASARSRLLSLHVAHNETLQPLHTTLNAVRGLSFISTTQLPMMIIHHRTVWLWTLSTSCQWYRPLVPLSNGAHEHGANADDRDTTITYCSRRDNCDQAQHDRASMISSMSNMGSNTHTIDADTCRMDITRTWNWRG
jgi:hypothetical protein